MSFAKNGVNIPMRVRFLLITMAAAMLWSFAGCGGTDDSSSVQKTDATYEKDRQEIKNRLEETAKRWRYGDKAVLYEQEFEYYQIDYTYDDYLEVERVKRMESDTVDNFVVRNIDFFDHDSAHVDVNVVFVGVLEDTTILPQTWTMYYHQGRWIRPSMSTYAAQQVFEEVRRKADSAAEAEENEDW